MRWTPTLFFYAGLAVVSCSGSSFSESEGRDAAAGSAGTAGSAGAGGGSGGNAGRGGAGSGGTAAGGTSGASGTAGSGGSGQDGGKTCVPMPGCSSNTLCNDGCNTCSCFNGEWACTARACPLDAALDAPTRTCETDQDCIFRSGSGCCGVCLAKTDPVPPPIPCGAACPIAAPGCVCIDHKCGTGTVPQGGACDLAHDLCSYGLLCCQRCAGPTPPDGGNCSPPVCTQPTFSGGMTGCPPPLP
jgi:hypothetical protein